jgi:hypothetical protein
MSWPRGHKSAFTIIDDTDWATIENVKTDCGLWAEPGMQTTISIAGKQMLGVN